MCKSNTFIVAFGFLATFVHGIYLPGITDSKLKAKLPMITTEDKAEKTIFDDIIPLLKPAKTLNGDIEEKPFSLKGLPGLPSLPTNPKPAQVK